MYKTAFYKLVNALLQINNHNYKICVITQHNIA